MAKKAAPNSVLFVCYLNMVRSPIAQGLLQKRFPEADIQSCGIETGELDDLMVAVMREKGVDMSGHKGQSLHNVSHQNFEHIIAFTEAAGEAAVAVFGHSNAVIETWVLPEPTQGSLDVRAIMNNYRAIRDNLEGRLTRYFA